MLEVGEALYPNPISEAGRVFSIYHTLSTRLLYLIGLSDGL